MGIFDDEDKPKRLSLRERMALREDGSENTVSARSSQSDSSLRKYRQSREINEDDTVETQTKRRVIRLDENGNEEVTIRERNITNSSKDDVKRNVERKTKNNESLAEEKEPDKADSNNNKMTAEITIQPTKTAEERKRERAERRANRQREIEITTNNESGKSHGAVTIETSITTDGITTKKTNRITTKSDDKNDKIIEVKTVKAVEPKTEKIVEIKTETEKVPKPETKKVEKTKIEELKPETKPAVADKRASVRDRFNKENETRTSIKGKFDFKSNEAKTTTKFERKPNEKKTVVVEENVVVVEQKPVESANVVVEEKKDTVAELNNKNKFGSKTTPANKRPQSMVDFKSKFENKTSSSTPTENKFNKRPMSMNIKSKFEQGGGDTKPAKFQLKKTILTPVAKTTTAPSSTNTTTTKTEKDKGGVHSEIVTTKTETTKGEGVSKQEIKETKTVETKDTNNTHAEKKTTVTETKTAGGTMTVKKTETKVETKQPALKKTGTSTAKSVEERMKERKQKEAMAKKQQSSGRNAFKLKLEANAGPVNVKLGGGSSKSPGMMAGLASPKTPTQGDSNIDKLLKWIAKRINQYPAVEVKNFTSSWADGIALCALMNYLLGDEAMNPLAVSPDDKQKNFELALECGTKHGVPALIDATEMAQSKEIDRRSMITYLHTVYKVLWHDKQEKK